MEKDQVPASRSLDAKMKSDMKTKIIATFIVSITVLGAVFAVFAEWRSDGDDADAWDPAVGDYYTFTQTVNDIADYVTLTYTVIDVTSTTVTFNETMTYLSGYNGSRLVTIASNQNAPYSFGEYIEKMPDNVQDNGYQAISTEWGYVLAHHYSVTFSFYGHNGTSDVWFYNGFLVKLITVVTGFVIVMELSDTNIDF